MNNADIVILAVLVLSVLFGLWRGFVAEILALVCWIAAFWVAWMFGGAVATWYGQWLHEANARIVAGYLTCFLGVLAVGALLGWAMRKLLRGGGLSGTDRFLGMLFGFVRGVLLITVAVLVLGFTIAPREPWWRQSQLLPPFSQGAVWLSQQLSPDVAHYLEVGAKLPQTLSTPPYAPISPAQVADPDSIAKPVSSSSAAPPPDVARDHHHPGAGVGQ